MRWQLAQIGALLPLVVAIQGLLAAGVIVGFGFLVPDMNASTALFLSTGTPTVLLLTIGLVMVPQGVVRARLDGTFDYMRTWPIARPLLLVAEASVWLGVALPSIAVAVLVAWLRFDLAFAVDWPLLVGAVLLVTLMGTSVGYALAVSLSPMLAQLVTQVLVFFVLLFSPVAYPATQLPSWFATMHDVLPIRPGADLVRAGLAADAFPASGHDLAVLAVWTVLGLAVSLRALVRRV